MDTTTEDKEFLENSVRELGVTEDSSCIPTEYTGDHDDPIGIPIRAHKGIPRDKTSPYTNVSGNYLLSSLFLETQSYKQHNAKPIYTLKDKDHTFEGVLYPSLYRLYIEEEDLTEYFFATKYLEDYQQWLKLCSRAWFKEHLQRWRTELEMKLKAEALKRLIKEAKEGGKNQYNANKFLIEKGWIDKTSEESRRGRPSKQEIARKAAEEVFSSQQISDAMKRLEIN